MMNGLLKMPLFIPTPPSISVAMMAEVPMTILFSDKGVRGASPKKYCVGVTQEKAEQLPARLSEFSAIIFPFIGN